MKRQTYYQVHKNKYPRRKQHKGYRSAMFPLIAINAALSCSQIGMQQATPGTPASNIVLTTVKAALATINIIKTEPLRRYKATGRYGRIKTIHTMTHKTPPQAPRRTIDNKECYLSGIELTHATKWPYTVTAVNIWRVVGSDEFIRTAAAASTMLEGVELLSVLPIPGKKEPIKNQNALRL